MKNNRPCSIEYNSIKRFIPNLITFYRVIIALPIIISLEIGNQTLALMLFLSGGYSDWLDGFVARKYGFKSILGARLDPLADKILICAPLIWIAKQGWLPSWAIWLTISRELIISGWRADHKSGAPASILGKLKTILQFISIILILFPSNFLSIQTTNNIRSTGLILFWPGILIALISGVNYLIKDLNSHQQRNQD